MPHLIFRIPAFVLSVLQEVLRISNVSQGAAVTVNQEFACLGSQLLQLAIANLVGNPETTEIIEATRDDNRCIEGSELLLTILSQYQFYTSS